MDLDHKTIIQSIGYKSAAQSNPLDRMFCVASGFFNVTLVSAWERLLVEPDVIVSPIDFNAPNLKNHPNFEHATKYYIDIESGDCLYIPAYWW